MKANFFLLFLLLSCSSPVLNTIPVVPSCSSMNTSLSGQSVTPMVDCSVCLSRCSEQLGGFLDVYLKVRSMGVVVALREGVEEKK